MDALVVQTRSGAVRGKYTHGVRAFLGIPFAEPAVGRARFEVPQPRKPWADIRDATKSGPTALQAPYQAPMDLYLSNAVVPGDDYLNINVWAPDVSRETLAPVIVWIHGGAFVRGANSVEVYDGTAFARDGVVLVGVNYRLGVSGFPLLDDAPCNLGIRDQILALEWVRDNIEAFGGDPSRITIMGESAGAMSVATLMASPAAKGLFHQAIMQSGTGVVAGTTSDLRNFTEEVARLLDAPLTSDAFGAVEPSALLDAELQAIYNLVTDARPARWGETTIRGGFGIMPTFPAIDGEILNDLPQTVIADGASSDIPLLIGTTAQEFNLWSVGLGLERAITSRNVRRLLESRYQVPAEVVDSYSARRAEAKAGQIFSDVLTDLLFREPSLRIAESRCADNSAFGENASTAKGEAPSADTFMFEFAWKTDVSNLGACHALELAFVFDTLPAAHSLMSGPNAPQSVADDMHAAWVRFAKTGDPGWSPYDLRSRSTRVFGGSGDSEGSTAEDSLPDADPSAAKDAVTPSGGQVLSDPRREDREAWHI